jgi:hypothetical protein
MPRMLVHMHQHFKGMRCLQSQATVSCSETLAPTYQNRGCRKQNQPENVSPLWEHHKLIEVLVYFMIGGKARRKETTGKAKKEVGG